MNEGKRKYVWWILALVVVIAVYGYVRVRQARTKGELHYETAKVERGNIVAKVTATGTLSAIVTVQVGSQVSGRIAALYADFNSPVRKGELIAKIDPQLFEASVAQARANYVAAQGNLAKAKAEALDAERQYKRNITLAERKLIAQADLDTSQATYDADKAAVDAAAGSVEQAKAQLNSAQVNLAYTNIISPTDGTVIARNVDVGQTVAASLQAPTLFLIAEDLRKMQVDTNVAESDIGKLSAGMKASFTVDAYPTETFTGVVRQVRNNPQTLQNVVTYDAVIDVDNPDLKLKPGMTANCTFVYAQRNDVLRVANAALRFRPTPELVALARGGPTGEARATGGESGLAEASPIAGGARQGKGGARTPKTAGDSPSRKTVWVLRDSKPQPVTIEAGLSDGTVTEVTGGDLHDGDVLITDVYGGASNGRSGARVGRMF
jgi:HlyD family secretion protein